MTPEVRAAVAGYLSKEAVQVDEEVPMWKRPVSSTVGRITAPLKALILGSVAPFTPGPDKEYLERRVKEYEKWEDARREKDEEHPELKVRTNRVRPIADMKEIVKRKDLSPVSKAVGILATAFSTPVIALTRGDHYNPWAHTASVFS